MKRIFLGAVLALQLTGCALQRHEYLTLQPVKIYAEEHLSSRRLQDIPTGAVVAVYDQQQVGSLYLIPVDYQGYKVYAHAPSLQYKGARRLPKRAAGNVDAYPAHTESADEAGPRKTAYRSYPGGRVFYGGSAESPVAGPSIASKNEK